MRSYRTANAAQDGHSLFRDQGTYIITGGGGGLGRLLATHLATDFRANLVLAARSPRGPAIEETLRRLRATGSHIDYVPTDVTERDSVDALVRYASARFGAIHGVVHAAGIARDGLVRNKSLIDLQRVLAPKVRGVQLLDEALAEADLDFFILFSSFAAARGNPGQSDYAYANRFLDEFAFLREQRRIAGTRRGRTLSLGWPFWMDGGMFMSSEQLRELEQRAGLVPLSREDGLRALRSAWALGEPGLIVSSGHDARIEAYLRADHPALRLAYQKTERPTEVLHATAPDTTGSLLAETEQYLKQIIGATLSIPSSAMDTETTFEQYGLESIGVHRFNAIVEAALGHLPKTLLYEHKNIRELADHLLSTYPAVLASLFGSEPRELASPRDPAEREATEEDFPRTVQNGDIAIIGISGRYPMAPDLDAFWKNLETGRDCITTVPSERWTAVESEFRWGGFLAGVDQFDPFFFNMAPRDATLRDPQERLFLQTTWELLERAGYPRHRLAVEKKRDVGVFVGVTSNTYESIAGEAWGKGRRTKTHAYPWSIANQVSYFLDLSGPSVPVDTACSSSLTAIHLACESIKRGECSMAIAGGVNLYVHPSKYAGMSQVGMLSPTGRCHTFGAAADGFVPGEGVGAALLKPLSRARLDRDPILAVIRATAINHGGRTSGYTVPNPNAQAELISFALGKAGIDASTVSYVEAHGTGTLLGDPIEISGLTRAFREHTTERQFCAIGSLKSNIGHLEAAAGIAGLTKVVLQMKNRQLVPSLHAAEPNPNIDFASSPFFVQQRLQPWEQPVVPSTGEVHPRRAGISSFGAGGANAHILVEEYREATGVEDLAANANLDRVGSPCYVCVLSARNAERLRAAAERLVAYLETHPGSDMMALAYTLQIAREPLEERLAAVVSTQDDLIIQLRRFIAEETASGHIHRGTVKSGHASWLLDGQEGETFVRTILAARKLSKLAQLWVDGAEIDWRLLYEGARPRCIELPTYPFEGRRCWLDLADMALFRGDIRPQDSVAAPVTAKPPVAPRRQLSPVDLRRTVQGLVAAALLTDTNDIDVDSEFSEYGIDSILLVDIVGRINDTFRLSLKPTQIYSYPSIAKLVSFLLETHGESLVNGDDAGARGEECLRPSDAPISHVDLITAPVPSPTSNGGYPEIAIVGMSGRFPDAEDVDQFWVNLREGRNSIREIPSDRWNFRDHYDDDADKKNKTYCKYGAFLNGADEFDPLFFSIAPKEARLTDPQQRLFLQEAWKALEDAGYSADEVAGSRCGVFVGAAQGDYDTLDEADLKTQEEIAAYSMVGPVSSMLAARVSHFLNLKGPSMTVDTTCSSSLVALHMACQSLHAGESDLAVSGGVYLRFSPLLYVLASRSGALSPDGQCKAFDDDANGFGIGEAVAAVILKPLPKAVADGDHIYGVVRSSGINHDGRTNGILAPNGESQTALEREVYRRANNHPESIGYVEAHATGTRLGDPIEVDALTAAFRQHTDKNGFCPIGTVKTNIGHCVTGSGIAGVVKVLLSLKHELIPPSLLCNKENELIDFRNSPFFVNKTLRPWPREPGRPRRAAISSFGFSGTNCHMIIEEGPADCLDAESAAE